MSRKRLKDRGVVRVRPVQPLSDEPAILDERVVRLQDWDGRQCSRPDVRDVEIADGDILVGKFLFREGKLCPPHEGADRGAVLVDDLVQAKRRLLNLQAGLAGILCFVLGHHEPLSTYGNEAGASDRGARST